MTVMERIRNSIKKDLQEDIHKASRFFKNLSVLNTLFLVISISVGTYFGARILRLFKTQVQVQVQQGSDLEVLMRNVQVMNEPAILLKIIREKAPKLPAETQARATDTIFRVCTSRNIPMWLACGLAEVESGMDPFTKDSSTGAKGWYQVMPSTARPFMDTMSGGGYSPEKAREPITNAICGLNYFANLRDEALEMGMSQEKATNYALFHYGPGTESYPGLVLKAAAVFKARFETPMKELGNDRMRN